MSRRQRRTTVAVAVIAGCVGTAVGLATARTNYPSSLVLFQGHETVLGQSITYPAGEPQVTGAIVTMAPGQATGWHRHDAPLFAYVLEGEITVDYGAEGTRRYVAGDTLLEALEIAHDGTNTGTTTARLLVVFMGAEGVANTTPLDVPN